MNNHFLLKNKHILLVHSPSIPNDSFYSSLLSLPSVYVVKSSFSSESIIQLPYEFNNTKYILNISKQNLLITHSNVAYDAIIYIYNSNETFYFINEYDDKFHSLYGNKNWPTVYVDLQQQYQHYLKQSKLLFPSITFVSQITHEGWFRIFNEVFQEIKKEKNDHAPYNTPFIKSKPFEVILQSQGLFKMINYLICLLIALLSLIDLGILKYSKDYMSIPFKVNELVLNIKLHINIVNVVCSGRMFNLFRKGLYSRISSVIVFGLCLNMCVCVLEMVIRVYMKSIMSNINDKYFNVSLFRVVCLLGYVSGVVSMKYFTKDALNNKNT